VKFLREIDLNSSYTWIFAPSKNNKTIAVNTMHHKCSALRALFTTALNLGLIDLNVADSVYIECEGETLTSERIPMFHAEGPSSGLEFSWGEYARTFAPSSEDFKTLNATRNDTESRHTALKRRIRHMPEDVNGQNLNLLGAAFLNNAITGQFHLRSMGQAHHLATG
jgi:hypothetical protein